MFTEYIDSGKISNTMGNLMVECRNGYSYPCVRLVATNQPTSFRLSDNLWASPDESEAHLPTNFELDEYHKKLLESQNPEENLLGTASVIFWGFYTFTRTYALNKVKWHLEGYKSKPASTPNFIREKIEKSILKKDVGLALNEFSEISQLGSIPFASKVIAFMRPEMAGIYDNQIHKGITGLEWYVSSKLNTRIGMVNIKSVQEGYSRWCAFLTDISTALNNEIDKGSPWSWSDRSGKGNRWRALDVERAIFNYCKTKER